MDVSVSTSTPDSSMSTMVFGFPREIVGRQSPGDTAVLRAARRSAAMGSELGDMSSVYPYVSDLCTLFKPLGVEENRQ
jgi:hypothetical protein